MSRLVPLLLLLAACGTDTSLLSPPPPTEAPTDPDEPAPIPPVLTPDAFVAGCPVASWRAASTGYGVIPGPPEYSPNGALVNNPTSLYLQGSQYARRFDGLAAGANVTGPEARSKDWNWEAWRDGVQVVLQRNAEPKIRHEWPDPSTSGEHLVQLALTPQGSRFVFAFFSEESTRLEVWRSEDKSLERTFTLEGASSNGWQEEARLHVVDEQTLFVLGNTQVLRVDLNSGEVRHSKSLVLFPSRVISHLVSFAANPTQDLVALTTTGNELYVLTASTLEVVQGPDEVLSFMANQDIFAPQLPASPVAWSSDGLAIAHLDPDGDVIVRELSSGDELRRFPAPEWEPDQWQAPYAVGLAFAPDGQGLAVASQSQLESFDCVGSLRRPEGELDVTVTGPSEAWLGDDLTFEISVANTTDYWVSQFMIRGDLMPTRTPSTIVWSAFPEGQITLDFVVDDGIRRSIVQHTVSVRPAE